MIAVVVRSYPASGLEAIAHYLTHDARHLAVETNDGSPLPAALAQLATAVAARPTGLAITQLALSLAREEHAGADTMFAAGRALLAGMRLRNRPTIAVLHGPPDAAHQHLHLVLPLVDGVTGEWQPLSRLPRVAWSAAQIVAPRFGWAPPPADDRTRRREPRAARSLGAWHGHRSLHAWVGEVVGPRILTRIDGAQSWAEVGATLAEFGLRYARTERGAVIEDYSSQSVRRVPASALAFRASAPALEGRLGPTPTFPVPRNARANPAAYANDDEGRDLGIGTPAERRAFAAAHATWRAVWLPVRDQRLAEQRAREAARRSGLAERVRDMRSIRDAVAHDRPEWLDANRFVRAYRDLAGAALRERAKTERAALRALPFTQRPPSRLREWLRLQAESPSVPVLRGECPGAPDHGDREPAEPGPPLRRLTGFAGTTEWWSSLRRVAIDRGTEIVICDRSVLPVALSCAQHRWSRIQVAGEPDFREQVHALATAAGILVFDAPREERDVPLMPEVPEHARIRTAAAIAQHLGLAELVLDGTRFRTERPERQPPAQAGIPATLSIDEVDGVALAADRKTLRAMADNGFTPALSVDGAAVFPFGPFTTADERAAVVDALVEAYGVGRRQSVNIDGPIRYHAAGVCEGVRRLLCSLRPTHMSISFNERVRVIQQFLDDLAPPRPSQPGDCAVVPIPAPVPGLGRRRGSRAR